MILHKGVEFYSNLGSTHAIESLPKAIGDFIITETGGVTSPFSIVDYAVPDTNTSTTYANFYCRLQWKEITDVYLYIYCYSSTQLCYGMTNTSSGVTTLTGGGIATVRTGIAAATNLIVAFNDADCIFSIVGTSGSFSLSTYCAYLKYVDVSDNTEGYFYKSSCAAQSLDLVLSTPVAYLYNQYLLIGVNSLPYALDTDCWILDYYPSSVSGTITMTNKKLINCKYCQGRANDYGEYVVDNQSYVKCKELLVKI